MENKLSYNIFPRFLFWIIILVFFNNFTTSAYVARLLESRYDPVLLPKKDQSLVCQSAC